MLRRERAVRYLSFLFLIASLLLPFGPAQSLAQDDLQTGDLTILLLDDAGTPVGGGSFEIATTNGAWSADDVGTGEVVLSGLALGPATITHVAGPDGYTTGSSGTVEITPGGMATVTLGTSLITQPDPVVDTPAIPDDDLDGVPNDADNCVFTGNPDQADFDGDGIGDACDEDIDGDGLDNVTETAHGTDPWNGDTDGDGTPDGLDADPLNAPAPEPVIADRDADTVPDDTDLCPDIADPDQLDVDGNGVGDPCDSAPPANNPPAAESPPGDDGSAPSPAEATDNAIQASGAPITQQSTLPVTITFTCPNPSNIDGAGQNYKFAYQAIIRNDAEQSFHGLILDYAREGSGNIEMPPLSALASPTFQLYSYITEADMQAGNINIPAPGITVTDPDGNSVSSGLVECDYTPPPPPLEPIALGSDGIFFQPYCDQDGYHAPRVVVPADTDTVSYWYNSDQGREFFVPGETVTVGASWDASRYMVNDFGAWVDTGSGTAQQQVTFTTDLDCTPSGLQVQISGPATYSLVGEYISFDATIINVGQEDITGIVLTDELTGKSWNLGALQAGNTWYSAANWSVQVAPEDIGDGMSITSTVTATGTGSDNNTTVTATTPITVTYKAPVSVNLDLVPTWTQAACSETGTLTRPTLILPADESGTFWFSSDLWSEDDTYLPGQRVIVSAYLGGNHLIADVADGWAIDPENPRQATFEVIFDEAACGTPGLTLNKSAQATYSLPYTDIWYDIEVTNSGEQTLVDIVVSDPMLNMEWTIDELRPGASEYAGGSYYVQPEDIDAERTLENTATATGFTVLDSERERPVPATSNTVTVTYKAPTPVALEVDIESLVGQASCEDGTLIPPTLTLPANTGQYWFSSWEEEPYRPGQSLQVWANTVEGYGFSSIPDGWTMPDDTNHAAFYTVIFDDIDGCTTSGITITKIAWQETYSFVDEYIGYEIRIENTGQRTLTDIVVTDDLTDEQWTFEELRPGGIEYAYPSYWMSPDDISAGSVTNTASVSAQPVFTENDEDRVTDSASATVTYAEPEFVALGPVAVYEAACADDGSVTPPALEIPASVEGIITYETYDQEPFSPGQILNVYAYLAPGYAFDPESITGGWVSTEPRTARFEIIFEDVPCAEPDIEVTKIANPTTYSSVGDNIWYEIKVTNTGQQTLQDVVVSDELIGLYEIVPELRPGATYWTWNSSYNVTEADIVLGVIENSVTVSGTAILSREQVSDTATAMATYFPANLVMLETPGITQPLCKDGELSVQPGIRLPMDTEGVIYRLEPEAPFHPGQRVEVHASSNVGYAFDDLPDGWASTGLGNAVFDVTFDDVPCLEPGIEIEQTVTPSSYDLENEMIYYQIVVTNTGGQTLVDTVITTDFLDTEWDLGTLAPGERQSVWTEYSVRGEDIATGEITNKATVTALAIGSGQPLDLSDTDTATYSDPVPVVPAIPSVIPATCDEEGYTPPRIEIDDTDDDGIYYSGIHETLVPGQEWEIWASAEPGFVLGDLPGDWEPNPTYDRQAFLALQIPLDADCAPALSIQKSVTHINEAETSGEVTGLVVGDVVRYRIEVENTGTIPLTDVGVTDWSVNDLTCTPGASPGSTLTLQPGDDITCTATYRITPDDIENGQFTNWADTWSHETGSASTGFTVYTANVDASISLTKTASIEMAYAEGDAIIYTFRVQNTGGITLRDITIDDPMLANAGAAVTLPNLWNGLAPGQAVITRAVYHVTDTDIAAGIVENSATVSANIGWSSDTVSSDVATATVDVAQGAIGFTKTSDRENFTRAGDVIAYTLTVTNSGETIFTGLSLADELDGLSPLTCAVNGEPVDSIPGSLDIGQELVCAATYTIHEDDLSAGAVTNSATLSADGIEPITRSVTVTLQETLSLEVDKSVTNPQDAWAVGDTVAYHITITNNSNVPLAGVTVSDPQVLGLACEGSVAGSPHVVASLAPGASAACTATYTIQQVDIDRGGQFTNTATATGTSPAGDTASGTDSVTVALVAPAPALGIVKSVVDQQASYAVDDIVRYELVVTNTGNVTLTSITVTDDLVTDLDCGTGSGTIASMAPGEEAAVTCTATYTIVQDDIDTGESIVNIASASGIAPDSTRVNSDPSQATVSVEAADPDISLVKSADRETVDAAGQEIAYTFTVTNDGNVTLTGIGISDQMLADASITATCPDGDLVPGASIDCTATYPVSQDDLNAGGSIDNAATAFGAAPDESTVTSVESEVTVTVTQVQSLTVTKVVTHVGDRAIGEDETVTGLHPGDTVHYRITATNAGNVTLTGVTVTDGMLASLTCAPDGASLAPAGAITCTGSYTLVESDIARWEGITNTANASGTAPNGDTVSGSGSVTVWPSTPDPVIELTKQANPASYDTVGQEIVWTLTLTNTGEVAVQDITVTDTGLEDLDPLDCGTDPPATLEPGDDMTCTVTHAVTQGDIDAGSITNTASARAESPNGTEATDTAEATVTADQRPGMTFTKSVTSVNDKTPADPVVDLVVGDTLTYVVTATNAGNVTLDIAVADAMFGAGQLGCAQPASIAPGISLECTVQYTVTQADLDRGVITNDASAVATAPDGSTLEDDASVTVWTAAHAPGMTMQKSVAPATVHRAGEQVTWSFAIANTGNVTITDLAIDDPMLENLGIAVTCPETTVAPEATITCTAVYTVTQNDMDAGLTIVNEASASGLAPEPPGIRTFMAAQVDVRVVTSASSIATLAIAQAPALTLESTISTPGGGTVAIGFTVTNSGNISLTGVVVDSPLLASAGITIPPIGALAPGESRTVTVDYPITDADIATGVIRAFATASAGNVAATSAESEATRSLAAQEPEPAPTEPVEPAPAPETPQDPDAGQPAPSPTEPAAPAPDEAGEGTPSSPTDEVTDPPSNEPGEAGTATRDSDGPVVTTLPSTGAQASGLANQAWIVALIAAIILAAAGLRVRSRPGA